MAFLEGLGPVSRFIFPGNENKFPWEAGEFLAEAAWEAWCR